MVFGLETQSQIKARIIISRQIKLIVSLIMLLINILKIYKEFK